MRRWLEIRALKIARRLVLWCDDLQLHTQSHHFEVKDAAMAIECVMRFYEPQPTNLPSYKDVRGILKD